MNREYPFDLLRVLVAVNEAKSFHAGAKRLGLSPAAVSLKLKQLQGLSPMPIFLLSGKKKVLTRYGHELYSHARSHLQANQEAWWNLNRKFLNPDNLILRVGGRPEIMAYFAPRFGFAGRLELKSSSSREAIERLLRHEIDLAFSHERPDSPEVVAKKVLASGFDLVVHHRWLNGRSVAVAARDRRFLTETPCLLYDADRKLPRDWWDERKIPKADLKVKLVTQDYGTLRYAVEAGWGYTVLPSHVETSAQGVERFPLAELPRLPFYAVYPKDLKEVSAFREVIDRLTDH
ncbi:MAG: LysR family transcriptional regulator [Bacteriovoracia bacterium]